MTNLHKWKANKLKPNLETLPCTSLLEHPPGTLQHQEHLLRAPQVPSLPLCCWDLQEQSPLRLRDREVVIPKLFEKKLVCDDEKEEKEKLYRLTQVPKYLEPSNQLLRAGVGPLALLQKCDFGEKLLSPSFTPSLSQDWYGWVGSRIIQIRSHIFMLFQLFLPHFYVQCPYSSTLWNSLMKN